MFVLLSIIFVICVISIIILRNTTQYANNFVRVDYNHIFNLLFKYNLLKAI